MFLLGVPSIKPIVGGVEESSIAAKAGVISDSEIVEIANRKIRDWQDVNLALVENIGKGSIEVVTRQNDSIQMTKFQLNTKEWQFSPEKKSAIESLGFIPFRPSVQNEIALVAKDSPAQRAGVMVGDIPLAVNDVVINKQWVVFTDEVKKYPNKEISIEIERNGVKHSLIAKPSSVERNGQTIGYLGIAPKSDAFPEKYRIEITYGIGEAFSESLARTWQLVTLSFDMIGKLITGDVSVKNLSGPIAIAQGAGDHAGYGFVYFLGFLALISINLGIINILPVPVLDGGHLVYYVIELFTGKPVSEKIQELGFKFGTIALLGLMSIALFNDLSRL